MSKKKRRPHSQYTIETKRDVALVTQRIEDIHGKQEGGTSRISGRRGG